MNFSTRPPWRSISVRTRCVVRIEESAHVLRVEALGFRREAHEVDEDHRDDTPLLAAPVRTQRGLRRTLAESRNVGVVLTAAWDTPAFSEAYGAGPRARSAKEGLAAG